MKELLYDDFKYITQNTVILNWKSNAGFTVNSAMHDVYLAFLPAIVIEETKDITKLDQRFKRSIRVMTFDGKIETLYTEKSDVITILE